MDITSYHPADFILFSADVYFRLFERYNQEAWPLQVVAIFFAGLLLTIIKKRPTWSGQGILIILAISWCWVAWGFLHKWFYQVHVAANGYAIGFILQVLLMSWYSLKKKLFTEMSSISWQLKIGTVLLVTVLLLYPFIAVLSGRYWWQFEMFAMAPDPTVLATFAILILHRASWVLYVIPITWVIITITTLSVM